MATQITLIGVDMTGVILPRQWYYEDAVFYPDGLYWNTGSGYITTQCLNASGLTEKFSNVNYDSHGNTTYDYYIGSGTPAESPHVATEARNLAGLRIGRVRNDKSRSQTGDGGSVISRDLWRYTRSISVNNTQYGSIDTSGSWSSGIASTTFDSWYFYELGGNSVETSVKNYRWRYGIYASQAKDGCKFVGWFIDGEKVTSTSDGDHIYLEHNGYYLHIKPGYKADVVATAVFAPSFSVSYNANGGTGSAMAGQTLCYGISDYETQQLSDNTYTRALYTFTGWNTAADGSGVDIADGASADEVYEDCGLSAGGSVTLYAQWRFVGFNLTATKTTSAGTLTLQKDGTTVATESSGTLTYTGAADGAVYQLVCTMADGYALPPMPVSPTEGASLSLVFANPLYFVSLPSEDASGNSFSGTTPAEPDGTVDGKDAYVAGRNVVVTATLGDEQMLTAAYLDDESHSNFATYTGESIAGDKFTITGIDRSCYVRGTFAARQYSVTCAADVASADALTVAVSASSVVKNTQVTFTATPAAGYSFEGWYLDGVKITDAGATYARTITGETHLVAKAKVAVTLTLATADTGTITVNGESYTPGTPFYVTLGESFDYAIEPAEGLRYRGWYTSDYPTSKARYPVSQRGTWPAPTASFTAVGVVLEQAPVDPGTPLAVEIAFADGSDSTMGELSIDGGSDLSIVKPYTEDEDTGEPTTYVTLNAVAKNGYVFLGWYENAAGQGDAVKTPEYTFPLTEDVALYARFAQNDHSICEWEGSTVPKALTWRTKTYEASKPFNPSACRVDALGYAGDERDTLLELTVDMFSAPNAAATATTTLRNIANQDARRLPVRRAERYMQIEIKANAEVDALLVGTSMGGLAQ